jgi:predicted dehydrogenase
VPNFLGAQEFTVYVEGQEPQTYSYPFNASEDFSFEIQHMHDCIAQGLPQSPILPQDESIQVMETMDVLRAQWGLCYSDE